MFMKLFCHEIVCWLRLQLRLSIVVVRTALDNLEDSPEIEDFSTQEINNENEINEENNIESQGIFDNI